jgi:hypothetical protein
MAAADKALSQILDRYKFDRNLFYGTAAGVSLGVGAIYRDVVFPAYDDTSLRYNTLSGLAYVLTHECDVDADNQRHFNTEVLVIPIILFEAFAEEFVDEHSEGALFAFVDNLAKDEVSRVMYVPPIPAHLGGAILPFGGLIYLNNICSSPVALFGEKGAAPVCAVSWFGLRAIDAKLQNHLLRPKTQILPRLR